MSRLQISALLALVVGLLFAVGAAKPSESAHGLLLVANKADHTVSIIDPESGTQTVVPESGITAHELTASGHLAFAPIYGNSGVGRPGTDGTHIDVIDIPSHKVVGNIDFGRGVRPHNAVLGPKDGLVYVTTELDQTVSIIDPATQKIVGTIGTGQPESHMLALSHDGRRGYTANVGPGTVSVLDMQARKQIGVVTIAATTQRISISPDDRMVFTADQTKPQLAVIDTASNKIKTWIPLPATAFGTSPTPDGRWLLATLPGARKVAVIDLAKLNVARTIDVPASPQEILVRPDGKIAYVSCDSSHKIAAIRTSDWAIDKLMDAGNGADGLAWAAGN